MIRIFIIASLAVSSLAGVQPIQRGDGLLRSGRIEGGYDVDIRDVPYQLSLEYYGSHRCGAAIVNENWAITAVHCYDGFSSTSIHLRAGSSVCGRGGSVHQSDLVVVHPDHDIWTKDYDVALIHVSEPFDLSGDTVKAAPLAEVTPDPGTPLTVSGWGDVSVGTCPPWPLQAVQVPVVERSPCRAAYPQYSLTERMFCAGEADGGKGPCLGDFGGPVVAPDGSLAGIVSWELGCARPDYPTVNTDIASLRGWIKNITGA